MMTPFDIDWNYKIDTRVFSENKIWIQDWQKIVTDCPSWFLFEKFAPKKINPTIGCLFYVSAFKPNSTWESSYRMATQPRYNRHVRILFNQREAVCRQKKENKWVLSDPKYKLFKAR